MSRLFIFLNIFLVLIANTTSLTEHNANPKPRPKQKLQNFVIPILKDAKTSLYYTTMTVGKPPLTVNLVLDISGSALYFPCGDLGYNSTTYAPVLCGSRGCPQPKDECFTTTCYGPFGPTCRNDTCISADVKSYLADTSERNYLLKDDVILSYSSSSSAHLASKLAVRARFACVPFFDALTKLPYGANDILGLSHSSTSFVNDLVSSYKIPFRVALCLPSKSGKGYSGNAYIGGGPYLLPPNRKDVTELLVSTPLMWEHRHITSYTIDVTSIEVNGKRVASNSNKGPWGPALVGKSIPYTRLHNSIYKALVKAFAGKAQKRKAMAPFTDCFSYKSFGGKTLLGKEIPVISLVLGGGAKWNIYGPNSLVKVTKNVVCLAFEGGHNEVYPIEIGSYQMEDNLVEFDLEASKFSVTSTLLRHNASCSPQ
ncbi:unnamed protein product [Eruca vesicaria subsp. sativa]|uniref:Peptidase A1 domain-containing protein n=1 Tax=Eruca vesicaria subsp. sativa TaxID=29727 RepID=A0ABC8M1D3_ERUVS|nr:unnamed protein product [Eruca vesicaria subsp. sativa]